MRLDIYRREADGSAQLFPFLYCTKDKIRHRQHLVCFFQILFQKASADTGGADSLIPMQHLRHTDNLNAAFCTKALQHFIIACRALAKVVILPDHQHLAFQLFKNQLHCKVLRVHRRKVHIKGIFNININAHLLHLEFLFRRVND